MTEAEIVLAKFRSAQYRHACRLLVRSGTPSRIGRLGPFLWDFAENGPVCYEPVSYRSMRGRYDEIGR